MHYDREKLRAVMVAQGRRYNWLAEQTGYDPAYVARVSTGQVPFSEKFARRVARVLGVPVELLEADEADVERTPA